MDFQSFVTLNMDHLKQQLNIINQFFEIERKLQAGTGSESFSRNFDRIRRYFEEMGYRIHNPAGEPYNETRTDCEASISGDSVENLRIREVIKPVVVLLQNGQATIVQKAVVIVASSASA